MAPPLLVHRSATQLRHRPLPSRWCASLPCSDLRVEVSCHSTAAFFRQPPPPPPPQRASQPLRLIHFACSRLPLAARASPRTPMPQISYHQHHAMPLQESVLRSPAGEVLTWIARLSCSEPLTRLYLAPRCTDCATTRHREAAAAAGESIPNNSSRPYKVASIAQQCMRLRAIVTNTHAICLAAILIPV